VLGRLSMWFEVGGVKTLPSQPSTSFSLTWMRPSSFPALHVR